MAPSHWQEEIAELHQLFQAYFLGEDDSLERVDAALAADFTIVGAHGVESSRAETMQMLREGHGHSSSLVITTTEHRLVAETADLVVASYVENHQLSDRTNHRQSTVVFRVDDDAPRGLRWVRVHETWIT